ncbi:hypothetical protein CN337_20915, partial [Bacillus anthracis]
KSLNVDNNSLANICIISRGPNNALSGAKPSLYKMQMPSDNQKLKEIMSHAMCPEDIFHDNFDKFLEERLEILVNKANNLMLNT